MSVKAEWRMVRGCAPADAVVNGANQFLVAVEP
jgi:hypothetical protein